MGAGGALSTRILVYGLWHLGSVTAACLAERFNTVGYDPDDETVSKLRSGQPPVFEPGLAELVQVGLSSGVLSFTDTLPTAAQAAEQRALAPSRPDLYDLRNGMAMLRIHIGVIHIQNLDVEGYKLAAKLMWSEMATSCTSTMMA